MSLRFQKEGFAGEQKLADKMPSIMLNMLASDAFSMNSSRSTCVSFLAHLCVKNVTLMCAYGDKITWKKGIT